MAWKIMARTLKMKHFSAVSLFWTLNKVLHFKFPNRAFEVTRYDSEWEADIMKSMLEQRYPTFEFKVVEIKKINRKPRFEIHEDGDIL